MKGYPYLSSPTFWKIPPRGRQILHDSRPLRFQLKKKNKKTGCHIQEIETNFGNFVTDDGVIGCLHLVIT